MFLEKFQYYPQMAHMLVLTLRIYKDNIDEDNYNWAKVIPENIIHKVHKSRWGIS